MIEILMGVVAVAMGYQTFIISDLRDRVVRLENLIMELKKQEVYQ